MEKENTQRAFIPGSKWVYYKVYCGLNTADNILTQMISPLSNQLINDGIIDQWFFIRYSDPENHLRIRFHLKDEKKIEAVMKGVYQTLESHVNNKLIWDLQLATYQRELERYGANTIEDLESFFYHDSEFLLEIIKASQDEETRFQQVFYYVNSLINLFISNHEEKLAFLDRGQSNFKTEFNANNFTKKQLSKKYRSFNTGNRPDTFQMDLAPLQKIANKILSLDKQEALELPLTNLLGSIVHMTVNRVFQSRQRLYEMVLYDFLHQKTRSDYYRQKKN